MIRNLSEFRLSPEERKVLSCFSKITDIPRPSGQEEQIRTYLIEKARTHNWEVRIDAMGNIALLVPASRGYEETPQIILQGHMDMVTFGGNDRSATEAFIDADGWVRARGTTLGADNGIGVALAIALAEDSTLLHGPLTLFFTVDEERGLKGANELDPALVPGNIRFLLNIDSGKGAGFICRGTAGGVSFTGRWREIRAKRGGKESVSVRIQVKGLRGGHSGTDIHKKRGNAIVLLAELLSKLSAFELLEIQGGSADNALPVEASALLICLAEAIPKVQKSVSEFSQKVRDFPEDFSLNQENSSALDISGEIVPSQSLGPFHPEIQEHVLSMLRKLPIGAIQTLPDLPDQVTISNTIGMIRTHEHTVEFTSFARAATEEDLSILSGELQKTFEEHGAEYEEKSFYAPWWEPDTSPALQLAGKVHREVFGKDPIFFSYHAGLECALIKEKLQSTGKHPNISTLSLGPILESPHSMHERLQVKSVGKMYGFLKALLKSF